MRVLIITFVIVFAAVSQHALSAVPTVGIAAGPVLQEIRAAPRVYARVEVKNPLRAPVQAYFTLYDLSPAGDLLPAGRTPHTLLGRITIPTPVTLRAGELQRLSIPIQGDVVTRFGALVVHVGGVAGVALRIVVAAPGARPVPAVTVTPHRDGRVDIALQNTGNAVLRVQGNLYLLREGNLLGRLAIPYTSVLPTGTHTITLRWPAQLPAGVLARVALTAQVDGKAVLISADAQVP